MSTFIDVINELVTTLQNDTALSSFSQTKWGKSLTVKKIFKERTEINTRDLPIILITRPSLEKSFLTGARDGAHTVRLYCGFHQNDRRRALEEFIEFEEKIDDALLNSQALESITLTINPLASANDEGKYHPVYFMVMDVEIRHRR